MTTPTNKRTFKVLNGPVKVRETPGGKELTLKLNNGDLVEVEVDSMRDDGKVIWWHHKEGWSAERLSDGTKVFMGDPSQPSADEPPDISKLPMLNTLFVRLPIGLEKVSWVQYFGNTQFAHKNGKAWNYDGFAQGMHPGLDLGNPKYDGIQVYAGLNGVFDKRDKFGFHVNSGDYHIIYQHLVNTPLLSKGAAISPDTVVGTLEPLANNNAHLHLEIRYQKEKFILNPLLFIPMDICDSCTKKFSAYERYFYKDEKWGKWLTPDDQPIILRSGPLIGPRA